MSLKLLSQNVRFYHHNAQYSVWLWLSPNPSPRTSVGFWEKDVVMGIKNQEGLGKVMFQKLAECPTEVEPVLFTSVYLMTDRDLIISFIITAYVE